MGKMTKEEARIAEFVSRSTRPIRDGNIYRVARKGRGTLAYFESKEAAVKFIKAAADSVKGADSEPYTCRCEIFDFVLTEEMKRDFGLFWAFFDQLVEWYEDENHEKWEEIPAYNRMILQSYATTVWGQKRFVDRHSIFDRRGSNWNSVWGEFEEFNRRKDEDEEFFHGPDETVEVEDEFVHDPCEQATT